MRTFRPAATLALAAAAALGACAKQEPPRPPPTLAPMTPVAPTPVPFKVTSVDLGRSIGDDRKIKDAAATFERKDTIYAAITSEGVAARAAIKVRWTFGVKGQLVSEETRDIIPAGPAVLEFHISKASGWPVGKYKVEVSADGAPVATKDFEVKK
jgi:hypothetical protein